MAADLSLKHSVNVKNPPGNFLCQFLLVIQSGWLTHRLISTHPMHGYELSTEIIHVESLDSGAAHAGFTEISPEINPKLDLLRSQTMKTINEPNLTHMNPILTHLFTQRFPILTPLFTLRQLLPTCFSPPRLIGARVHVAIRLPVPHQNDAPRPQPVSQRHLFSVQGGQQLLVK